MTLVRCFAFQDILKALASRPEFPSGNLLDCLYPVQHLLAVSARSVYLA